MRRRCSRENTTWGPEEPMSMPTLCRVTLSCCQIGLSSGGPHVVRAGSGGRLGREVLQLLLVRLVHPRLQAVLGQGLLEGLAHVGRLVGVVDLVAADALADPGLRDALRVADGHD